MKEKIVLGLSGGVDSAVAARLLQERYDVTGLYLDIDLGGTGAADAAAVAERLGIPFETADIRAELEREVCAPFAADYRAGRTPLPCARCNPAVKFPALFALAGRIGARYVSTGHYARVENGVLKKGMPANDQSYMLARLTREQLQKVIFPLGDYEKGPGARPGPGLWHPGGGQAGLHGDLLYPRRGLRRLAGEARVFHTGGKLCG